MHIKNVKKMRTVHTYLVCLFYKSHCICVLYSLDLLIRDCPHFFRLFILNLDFSIDYFEYADIAKTLKPFMAKVAINRGYHQLAILR